MTGTVRPALAAVAVALAAPALAGNDIFTRAGSPENFTGAVRIDYRFRGSAPATINGGTVTFALGARTAWHTHPVGQTLIDTAGVGLVQRWEGSIKEIPPGDVIRIPLVVNHWHGATPTTSMCHIAFSEAVDANPSCG